MSSPYSLSVIDAHNILLNSYEFIKIIRKQFSIKPLSDSLLAYFNKLDSLFTKEEVENVEKVGQFLRAEVSSHTPSKVNKFTPWAFQVNKQGKCKHSVSAT